MQQSPLDMDHYAADENYFTEEGIKQGHEDLLRKLEAKKEAHEKRRAAHNEDAAPSPSKGFSARSALVVVLIALAGMAGGWILGLYVLS